MCYCTSIFSFLFNIRTSLINNKCSIPIISHVQNIISRRTWHKQINFKENFNDFNKNVCVEKQLKKEANMFKRINYDTWNVISLFYEVVWKHVIHVTLHVRAQVSTSCDSYDEQDSPSHYLCAIHLFWATKYNIFFVVEVSLTRILQICYEKQETKNDQKLSMISNEKII